MKISDSDRKMNEVVAKIRLLAETLEDPEDAHHALAAAYVEHALANGADSGMISGAVAGVLQALTEIAEEGSAP